MNEVDRYILNFPADVKEAINCKLSSQDIKSA
jgi:hypothetical protein